jgi:hypothetical protein
LKGTQKKRRKSIYMANVWVCEKAKISQFFILPLMNLTIILIACLSQQSIQQLASSKPSSQSRTSPFSNSFSSRMRWT